MHTGLGLAFAAAIHMSVMCAYLYSSVFSSKQWQPYYACYKFTVVAIVNCCYNAIRWWVPETSPILASARAAGENYGEVSR